MKYLFKILVILVVLCTLCNYLNFMVEKHFENNINKSDNVLFFELGLEKLKVKPLVVTSNFSEWQHIKTLSMYTLENSSRLFIENSKEHPGENGTPVILKTGLKGRIQQWIKKGWRDHAFNEVVSKIIPLNRSLKDHRDSWCMYQNYSVNLPETSVIITFHNEAWSTLLRTTTSVLNRTPSYILKEIILIDDFSYLQTFDLKLKKYVQMHPKVKLIRTKQREGLVRARIIGATEAASEILVYLDSHCECTEGWIEPLLDRLSNHPNYIVTPLIDCIDDKTFEYIAQNTSDLKLGGFNWDLSYSWTEVPHEILIRRKHSASPIQSPTLSGGLFAVNKSYFRSLGYYDKGFEIWGAENLELSFKVWMCGGALEIVPCSRVGHVFRRKIPYLNKIQSRLLKNNVLRLANVWLDDYAKYVYERVGNLETYYGNLFDQKALREKLRCKSFEWYLKNIYPHQYIPSKEIARGSISSTFFKNICLDAQTPNHPLAERIKLKQCHHQGGNQFWLYTKEGTIQKDDMCLSSVFGYITMLKCENKSSFQTWIYDNELGSIKHNESGKCAEAFKNKDDSYFIILKHCTDSSSQKWKIKIFKKKNMELNIT